MLLQAKKILYKYPNQNIKFFLTPIFNKKINYALDIENNHTDPDVEKLWYHNFNIKKAKKQFLF